ncbi:MAG: hypothetical protein D6720_00660 [Gammaproteobacteria bacterium]|nr:MAG: hypothetical protein D6720_00660 [Gammaproteobacteria bacterium]
MDQGIGFQSPEFQGNFLPLRQGAQSSHPRLPFQPPRRPSQGMRRPLQDQVRCPPQGMLSRLQGAFPLPFQGMSAGLHPLLWAVPANRVNTPVISKVIFRCIGFIPLFGVV